MSIFRKNTLIGTAVNPSDFYTKTDIDDKLTDLTRDSFRDGVVVDTVSASAGSSKIPSNIAVVRGLAEKQNTITAQDSTATPTDTDKLSYLNNVTNNRWTFAKVWDWGISASQVI